MVHVSRLLAIVAVASVAACKGSDGGTPGTHEIGAETFVSQAPGNAGKFTSNETATGAAGASGAPVPAAAGAPTSTTTATTRTIEEADIYKRDGSMLYVLNTYRGLQILDLADVRAPKLVGHVALTGNPVDLYLRNKTALLAVNDSFGYVLAADGSMQPHRGSRVLAVDVTDPAKPVVVTDLPIEGAVEQTRLVGDVLYVVSNKYYWYDWVAGGSGVGGAGVPVPATAGVGVASVGSTSGSSDTIYVASFDLRDPAHPKAVGRIDFPATGWDAHANVTADRITISFAGYGAVGPNGAYGAMTRFQIVDISDPVGALVLGTTFSTVGQVKDRWSMDFTGGTFRAAVNVGFNQGAAVDLWASPDAQHVTQVSHVPIDVQESLTAARFDGPRIYVVTARRTDPLWAIDATDPSKPLVAGALHMPGQLDYIEPRGDRLVALGHTDEAGQPWQLQVSLLDVTQLSNPTLLSRVLLGTGYGSVAAKADDLRKAFLVFDPPPADIGLVLVPYYGYDRTSYRSLSGTQLVDLGRSTLTLRGFLGHPGMVTRAFPIDTAGTTLAALSDTALQTIDATDRGAPAEAGRVDLARSVSTLAIVQDKAVELAGDWWSGATELVVTDALDPDAPTPLARVSLAAPQGRLIQDGHLLWVLTTDWNTSPPRNWLQAVDFADPIHPVQRARLDLSGGETFGYVRSWGYGNDAVLVGHSLVLHHAGSPCFEVCALSAVKGAGSGSSYDPSELRIYDVSDPDHPTLASTLSPSGSSWAYGLTASGNFLWLTHFEWDSSRQFGSYYLDRIDLGDPRNPQLLPKINVPGVFFAASPDGTRIYTLETVWDDLGRPSFRLHRLRLLTTSAQLEATLALDGYPSGYAVDGSFAWLAIQPRSASDATRLVTVNLSTMTVSDDQGVKGSWAWLRTAAGGKLFLFAGWSEQGVLLYDLASPQKPTFDRFVRTSSWVWDVIVANGRAYLPSGPYGVPVIELR